MGNRANIVVKQHTGQVVLYTHWGGEDYALDLQKALRHRQRWDDPPYLARIIFRELTEGYERSFDGYGIDAEIGDNDHVILIVDCLRQTVYAEGTMAQWSFTEFCELSKKEIETIQKTDY